MKKLLIVTDTYTGQINGVVTTLENTVREMKTRGYEVKVIEPKQFFNFSCPIYKEIDIALPTKSKIEKIIDDFNPDYIHISTEWLIGILTRKILKKKGLSWSSSFHTRFPEYMEERFGFGKELIWKIMRRVYKDDQIILTTTNTMKEIMIENGIQEDKIKIWSRGVDENLIVENNRTNSSSDFPVLLNVGRVSVEKNLEDFYKLKFPGRKIQVGSGPMLEYYKEKYPDVEFVGPKKGKELFEFYKNSDVFVFPSKSDTFGLVMIEAMRCGLPVAAFPVTGPIDVIDDNITGVMSDNLGWAVQKCFELDKNKVRQVSKKYSWKNATDIFESTLIPVNGFVQK